MAEEIIEDGDSQNSEVEKEVVAETATEPEEPKFTDAERKAFARAKVAEAKVKELKSQLETKGDSKKSDEFNNGDYAYLAAKGIEDDKEIARIKEIQKFNGKSIREIVAHPDFQSELKNMRALKETEIATPTGKRSSGVATDSVEYWVAKAGPNAEHLDEVPKEMRAKVVNALDSKEKNKGQFYNS